MPAAIAPKAETLPNASVAVLVPAPLARATPEASELKTRPMEPWTVAVTVSVPVAVWATAADEIIISAAKMVKSTTFFIVVPLLKGLAKPVLNLVFNSVGRSRKVDGRRQRRCYRRAAGSGRCRQNNQIQVVRNVSVVSRIGLHGLRDGGQGDRINLVAETSR